MIHSLVFGGRGMSVVSLHMRLREISVKCKKTIQKIKKLLDNSTKQGSSLFSATTMILIIVIGLFSLGIGNYIFDQSCGFPGEGPNRWSNEHENLNMTTWNTRSLTNE